MAATLDAQAGLFDRVIEDGDLEAALEERERRRVKKADALAKFKETHDSVKGRLDALDLEEDTVVRCGRFRITVKATESRSVAFDTAPGRRTTISLLDPDA